MNSDMSSALKGRESIHLKTCKVVSAKYHNRSGKQNFMDIQREAIPLRKRNSEIVRMSRFHILEVMIQIGKEDKIRRNSIR